MINKLLILGSLLLAAWMATLMWPVSGAQAEKTTRSPTIMAAQPTAMPKAVFAGGCFWCTESEFRRLEGVTYTRVGYAGGQEQNPTYEQVSSHQTGHAEATEITYDPKIISYEELVRFFFTKAHDPTTLNRQGVDVGPQYRSVLFYGNDAEKATAEKVIAEVNASKRWKNPIVTQLVPATTFWLAEDYHQQYYEKYTEKTGRQHATQAYHEKRLAAP